MYIPVCTYTSDNSCSFNSDNCMTQNTCIYIYSVIKNAIQVRGITYVAQVTN